MQSKKQSLMEAILNVGSGFIISLLLWVYVVVPIWDIEVTAFDNLSITLLFTASAIARSYLWRRLFNSFHKGEK